MGKAHSRPLKGSRRQVPCLDQNGAALMAEWLVPTQVRAAHPCARRIRAELVFEDTIKHQNFLTTEV